MLYYNFFDFIISNPLCPIFFWYLAFGMRPMIRFASVLVFCHSPRSSYVVSFVRLPDAGTGSAEPHVLQRDAPYVQFISYLSTVCLRELFIVAVLEYNIL